MALAPRGRMGIKGKTLGLFHSDEKLEAENPQGKEQTFREKKTQGQTGRVTEPQCPAR